MADILFRGIRQTRYCLPTSGSRECFHVSVGIYCYVPRYGGPRRSGTSANLPSPLSNLSHPHTLQRQTAIYGNGGDVRALPPKSNVEVCCLIRAYSFADPCSRLYGILTPEAGSVSRSRHSVGKSIGQVLPNFVLAGLDSGLPATPARFMYYTGPGRWFLYRVFSSVAGLTSNQLSRVLPRRSTFKSWAFRLAIPVRPDRSGFSLHWFPE